MSGLSESLFLIAGALVVLGIIIVIHELGHFLVAKLFKIKVETFSVGFGPRLIGYKYGETDYRISALPLGGYVKMSGENPGDTITGDPREFLSKPKWQRFLVAAAGPAMNIILAGVLLIGVFMYGIRVPAFMSDLAVVGYVEPGSPAEEAGIRSGDRIVSLNGKDKPDWNEVGVRILINASQPLPITIERDGKRIESILTPIRKEGDTNAEAGMRPPLAVKVEKVQAGRPAEKAGLLPGDEIIAVNGIELKSQHTSFQQTLQGITEETFPIRVLRDGQLKELPITPVTVTDANKEGVPQKVIGIVIGWPTVMIKLGFTDAVRKSVDQNAENATLILTVLGKLFKPVKSGGLPVNTLEGPIGIIGILSEAFKQGLTPLLMVMATISLNLGLLNLLPVPILDGGVMLLIVIEGLIGHELSMRVKERIVQVSFVALLTLTAFVLYHDVLKRLPSGTP